MGSRITHFIALFGVLLLSFLALTSPVSASIQPKGLYDVEMQVKTQHIEERQSALKKGMADVVIRLAGSKGLALLKRKPDALDKASQYVEQYRYHKLAGDDSGLLLWARFNRKALLAALRELDIPVWAGARPETLIWLAIEGKNGRYILNSDKKNAWSHRIQDHAQRRGLPVLLPLMDLEDRRNTRIGDIWGGFTKSMLKASTRYEADDVMIGKVYRGRSGWNSRWTLVTAAGEKKWSANGKSASQAIATGLDGLADYMAARYSTRVSGQLARYRLVVNNVDTLQDYYLVSQYLRRIGLISRLQLDSVAPGSVVYAMDLRDGASALRQVLDLEQKLLPDDHGDDIVVMSGQANGSLEPKAVMTPEIMTYRLK